MRHPFFIFSQFFLFPGCFSLIFYFTDQAAHFLFFIDLFDFTIIFSVFMVLIFFSRCHVFYPLFHLSGLPFSFFVNNLTFSLLSTFFIPSLRFLSLIAISHHFVAFHCLSLPFLFFSPMSILHFPLFSRFLPFLNSFLSFLLFPPLPSFYTLFLPFFLDRPSFFRFYLCHSPRLIFHVSRLSKCFT